MDYNLEPPLNLYQRVLITESLAILTESPIKDDILRLFKHNSWDKFDKKWKEIEEKVKEIVEKRIYSLPKILQEEVFGINKRIGLEILEWGEYYGQHYCEPAFLNNICWTLEGAIDAEKTARKLVNDQSLSVLKRYRFACIHCFDDLIPGLWKQLNKKVSDEKYLDRLKRGNSNNSLVVFWSYHINGRVNEIVGDSSIYEYGLKRAIDQGSSVAAKYFWEKLTPEEKEKNLEQCVITSARKSVTGGSGRDRDPIRFPKSSYTNIFCFLLNKMDEERQMKIFAFTEARHSILGYCILKGLLHFPYQQFFIPTAERAWNFLQKKRERYYLLSYIADNISNYPQSYRRLLRYTWQKILDEEPEIHLGKIRQTLSELCKAEDHWGIELILNDSSVSAREEFICDEGMDICCSLVAQGKWNMLSSFMKYCLPNKDAALKFKEKERTSWYPASKELQDNAPKFYELINNFIDSFHIELSTQKKESKDNKRKREDDDSTSKKIKTNLDSNEVIKVYLTNTIGLIK